MEAATPPAQAEPVAALSMVRPVEALDGDGDEDEDEYGDEDVDEDGDGQGSTWAGFFFNLFGDLRNRPSSQTPASRKIFFVLCPGTGGRIPGCRPSAPGH